MTSRSSILMLKDLNSISSISSLLSQCNSHLHSTLYVKPNYSQNLFSSQTVNSDVFKMVSTIYSASDTVCPNIDVRVLLPGSNLPKTELCLSDDEQFVSKYDAKLLNAVNPKVLQFDSLSLSRCRASCLGGTFDRFHAAHRILLSEAAFLATDKIVIGLAAGALLENKFLGELILPLEVRRKKLSDFLTSIQSHLSEIEIVAIEDPLGPAGIDGSLQVIIVSEEVEKAVPMINDVRSKNGLAPLSYHVHNGGKMLSDEKSDDIKSVTDTVSSSSGRARLLGTLLKPPYKAFKSEEPYIIGLTGMLASGKSSVCKRLEKLGAYKVDADKLGHLAYAPETMDNKEGPAYKPVIQHFGRDVLDEEELFVDRKKLGAKVFANPAERKNLENLVWPAIAQLCKEEIEKASKSGYKVVVIEAAVLLEAGWESFVNEVWCCHVPVKESIERSINRDNVTSEMAQKRINAQIDLKTRVEKSNVVISTVWEPDVTQKIVEKAWSLLNERLQ